MHTPLALFTDLYQFTMASGYFLTGAYQKRVSFELFVRKLPPNRRFLVFAGLERVVRYLQDLRFTEAQIAYLKEIPALRRSLPFDFIEHLRDFRFRGDVWAIPEGTIVFAQEPLLRVTGTLLEAQIVETFLLSTINSETVVASKAARIVHAAQGKEVLEFGTRRCAPDEAVASARAAYLAGFTATSNVEAGFRWDIPLAGTAAHSWIMAHATEEEAFANYLKAYPNNPILLVDTYNTLEGVQHAIQAAGKKLGGIRLDSGDLVELSKAARGLLDEAGLSEAKIVATGDLNEYRIRDLLAAGAPIDMFGVGTELVKSVDSPSLGGVYKLVYDHDEDRPVAKSSVGKATLPGLHQVFRVERNEKATHDIIGTLPEFHLDAKPLLEPYMKEGRVVHDLPSLSKIRAATRKGLATMPESVLDLSPTDEHPYDVRLSDGLRNLMREVRERGQATTDLIPEGVKHL